MSRLGIPGHGPVLVGLLPTFTNPSCVGLDVNDFVVDDEKSWQDVAAAKRVCAGCTDRVVCVEWAISEPSIVGVWGGTTGNERSAIRTRRRRSRGLALGVLGPVA